MPICRLVRFLRGHDDTSSHEEGGALCYRPGTHPDLLGGDDIEANDPLRFLLLRREPP
jgi:hypothetical protein